MSWTLTGGAGGGYPAGTEGTTAIPGGVGGAVDATMVVSAGQQFTIQVGSEGANPTGVGGSGAGGLSGGQTSGGSSSGAQSGAGGGGATIIRAGGATSVPILVAAGGGGTGDDAAGTGGNGGTTGGAGGSVSSPPSTGGGGGNATTPGAGGTTSGGAGPAQGQPGAGMLGGAGAGGAGGGGGGYLAGGGGASNKTRSFYDPDGAGGGGGANYASSNVTVTTNGSAATAADGSASVSTVACPTSPTPTLNSVTSIGGGQVSLQYSFTSSDSTVTGAQYSIDGGNTWTTFPTQRTATGQWEGNVSGLSEGTYTFEVRATGSLDPSPASNSQNVTIPSSTAPRALPAGEGLYALSCDDSLPNGQLLSVNAATAYSTPVGTGSTAASDCFGQPAWDASTHTGYALDYQNNTTLDQVDVQNGTVTAVAPFTYGGSPLNVDAMAISPTGVAYVTDNTDLYSLNLATGVATQIGPLGQSALFSLAFDPTSGTLYGLNPQGQLFTINPTTGVATLKATLTLAPGNSEYSLQVASNGTLWIENDNNSNQSTVGSADLWSVDPSASPIASSAALSGALKTSNGFYYSEALLIVPPSPIAPTIVSAPSASATAGQPFSFTVNATGSPAPTFAISGGSLPAGVTLNPTTGVLSGLPTSPGSFTFTITATNSAGSSVQRFTLNIADDSTTAGTAPTIHLPIVSG